ncbi:ABC transporter permease [Desulfofundulus thermobenzoicus]|uniref:Autoinducer 2 import system permease protein LsrD n=1 Tax=Desulfofundulus thermobenzoicus TaxID=29376 RepID=A0A6N7IQI2_9FIRM|nr:ABC transporter permease [Desulfofundulus thermobenzoicus]MQL52280.1 ABC transporter permease [Desulfofundulus thermobenzoicus]
MKRLNLQLMLLDNLIWVLVVLFFLLNLVITPNFASYNNLINILYHSSILSLLILAEGLTLLIGKLDLSIESTLAFAPGIAMLLATKWVPGGIDPITSIFLTLLIGALVGFFNGYCIAKVGMDPLLQTLSVSIMLRGLVLFLVPLSIFPLHKIYTYAGQARLVANIPVAVVIVILVYLLFHFIMQHTIYGRQFLATGGNPKASFIAGINTERIVVSAFVLSGLLAAMAGLLTAGRQGSISNSMGTGMVMLAFAGAILGGTSLEGGKGTPMGMLGGALLLGMISNALNLLGVGVTLVYATQGALIFVAIVIDRIRVRIRNRLLHQEQIRHLDAAEDTEKGLVVGQSLH